MGSFIGHVVPGSFFGLFGLWWTWAVFHRYFMWQRAVVTRSLQDGDYKRGLRWKNTISFTSSCCPRFPTEGVLKIVAVIIGMTGEFVTGFENGKFQHIGNAQHMTMFFFFGLNGLVEVMTHCRSGAIPVNLDYVSGILAMCMEGLIFAYHLHGRSSMDVQVHTLLLYVIISNAVAAACEMTYKTNILPCLARIFFTLLQSTWFFQVGFILYPPSGINWDQENHSQMMIVTMLFTWHIAVVFIFMTIVGSLINCRVKYLDTSNMYKTMYSMGHSRNNNSSKMDAEQMRNMILESEEEM